MNTAEFVRRTFIVFAIAIAFALLWHLGDILLLGFGAIVIALVVQCAGQALARHLPLRTRWVTLAVWAGIVAVLAAFSYFVGDEVARQFGELRARLPEAWDKARAWLQDSGVGRSVLEAAEQASEEPVTAGDAARTVSMTLGALSQLFVVVLIAVYLSFNPGLYIRGVLALVPRTHRARVEDALTDTGAALRRWLMGQLVAMAIVGVLTGVGLWLVGVPLAFILGIVAGLLEFIPFAGPFLAAIPGLLLAFAVDANTALYALAVYVVVQQLEGALILPLAQKWSVELPPALGLFMIVVFGLLFGIPGILFATPLTVVMLVLVRKFYLEGPLTRP